MKNNQSSIVFMLLLILMGINTGFGQLDIQQLYFYNSKLGWGNGPNGTLVKTTDGGIHWIQQNSNTTEFIFKIFFINEDIGWACGLNGTLIKTTNGGDTWTPLDCGTNTHLVGVCFANQDQGWIVGDGGIILATQNGGTTWERQTSGVDVTLRFVQFVDANNGWVCGENGIVLHTTNGGSNWTHQITNTTIYLQWIDFVDPNYGFIAGGDYTDNSSIFLKTTDGGSTWSSQTLTYYPLFSTDFINADTGYVCGRGGTILKTTDGGQSWISQSYDGIWFSDVYFMSKDTIYVFSPQDRLLTTTNGGNSWYMQYINVSIPPIFYPLDITDVPNDNGKQVYLKWTISSSLNSSGITSFNIYRYDQQAWTYLIGVPPQPEITYQTIAPTLYDSTKLHGIYYSVFRVIAYNANSSSFEIIGPDSGYSIDNIPPRPPKKGRAKHDNNNTVINWDPAENTEGDLKDYILYRSPDPDYIPSPETQLAFVEDTVYTDLTTQGSTYYYKVTSRDKSGNESEALTILTATGIETVDPQVPQEYNLAQNYPNPFNPSTQIKFDIMQTCHVSLKVFDVSGKEVETLISEEMRPGTYTVTFAPMNLSSGMYFYRIQAGDFSSTKKMIFLK